MKISRWAGAACAGAMLFGVVSAEAQQYAPGAAGVRTQGGAYPPAVQRTNPGVLARPGQVYGGQMNAQRTAAPAWQSPATSLDAQIAAHLALGNAEEIAMSRYGEQPAESDEVRE